MKLVFVLMYSLLILFLLACEGDNTTIIVVVEESLPKIDCKEYVTQVGYGLANRGLTDSSIAKRAIAKAKEDCQEENKRRGY